MTIPLRNQKGKQTVSHHKPKEYHSGRPLDLIHTDLCGPMRTQATAGEYYLMLFIDDFTRMTWVSFLRKKDGADTRRQKRLQQVQFKTSSLWLED